MKRFYLSVAVAALFTVFGTALAFSQFATDFFAVSPPILGTAQAQINTSTLVNIKALSPSAQEELWVHRIEMGAEQDNVFYDEMIGGVGSGRPFAIEDDLSKVAGDTIHIGTLAQLGGPGVQGEGDRTGNEEKIRPGDYPVKVGRMWYGVGITDVAKEQTVIGGSFDNLANSLLRKRLGKKKSEDMLMILKSSAVASNTVRPNFKSTREALRTADVVNTPTITKAGLIISGLGGKPVKVAKSSAGADIEQFLFFGHQFGLASLPTETAYLQAITNAGVRGKMNPIFTGDFESWNGNGIYRWMLRDHDAYGAVGSTLLSRAFLGAAIVADNNPVTIYGGGDTTAATITPAPLFFEFFSNALYTFCNGNTVAADVTTERYVAIMNLTGSNAGKIGFYSYRINNGNTLTVYKRLRAAGNTGAAAGDYQGAFTTVGNVVYNTAPWVAAGTASQGYAGFTDAHPVGSLIIETNSYGVPFCGSLMLGERAGVCGHGSLKGRNARTARTVGDNTDHGMKHAVGVETCFGVAAVPRTDGKPSGYVYVESAYQVDGFPVVT